MERYFYDGVCEVRDKGGICYATKLPYDNLAKNKFACVTYDVGLSAWPDVVNRMQEADKSLTSYLDIRLADEEYGTDRQRVTADAFDSYRTGTVAFTPDKIKIIDITGGRYGLARVLSGDERYDI